MDDHEIERIANAINYLRPDWPTASLRTLLNRDELRNRPRRDVAVALVWVACESATKTPARVIEHGPWWQAAAVEAAPSGHQHAAKVHGWNEGDPRSVCGICGMDRPECERRAKVNGHEFTARIHCLPPHEVTPWRTVVHCGAAVIGGTVCRLRPGHGGDHEMTADLTTTAAHRDGHETTNDQRSA